MSSSNSPQTREPKPESHALTQESSDPRSDTNTSQTLQNTEERGALLEKHSVESITGPNGGEEEEEEGECGFCLFMKGGGCKDTFIEWEKCVEEREKNKEDIVEKCFQATAALKKCMEAHSDYYAPILQAEKVAEEEAVKELEKEKERLNSQGDGEKLGSDEKEETLKGSQQKKES
ncbi:uncharacterized protein LOC111398908 [Olea europaea var. sylvestris]|uniref:GCK domain-containing protein n=1 Tax=Olea europaea subsp. europaea TaxID=158383 RepID=A0A8S0P6G5_OLEEU|nr:uncharacterized protein LOC111398908 [Olea europaea var. sylvestris]CAA2933643.1 Hypothetical predicted protein [Olea europaea subsp. europaea]